MRKAAPGLKRLQPFGPRLAPVDSRLGEPCQVNGRADVAVARQHRQARDVVAVLVRDEDRVNPADIFADERQPPPEFPQAQPGIQQNTRVFGSQQSGVSGTPAGQHAELNDLSAP